MPLIIGGIPVQDVQMRINGGSPTPVNYVRMGDGTIVWQRSAPQKVMFFELDGDLTGRISILSSTLQGLGLTNGRYYGGCSQDTDTSLFQTSQSQNYVGWEVILADTVMTSYFNNNTLMAGSTLTVNWCINTSGFVNLVSGDSWTMNIIVRYTDNTSESVSAVIDQTRIGEPPMHLTKRPQTTVIPLDGGKKIAGIGASCAALGDFANQKGLDLYVNTVRAELNMP